MKQLLVSAISALAFAGCSNAEDQTEATPEPSAGQASQAETQPLRGNLENRYVQVAERGMRAQMLLYARAVPGGAERLVPITFDDEDRDVFRCVVREMRAAGHGDYLEEAIALNLRLADYIENTPSLSLMTLETNPEFQAMTEEMIESADVELSELSSINNQCGMIALTSEKLDESGARLMMIEAATLDE